MGDMDKSEKFTVAGYLFIPIGMFMFADADVAPERVPFGMWLI